MTLDEAKKIAAMCSTADGGCPSCVDSMCGYLNGMFPEFEWAYDDKAPEVELELRYEDEEPSVERYAPITVRHRETP